MRWRDLNPRMRVLQDIAGLLLSVQEFSNVFQEQLAQRHCPLRRTAPVKWFHHVIGVNVDVYADEDDMGDPIAKRLSD